MKRVVKTPPPPRAELVQQQAEEEERRLAAAAVKLAEIDQRIAQRKAEEAAVACGANAQVIEPEAEPAGSHLVDESELQIPAPSPQTAAPTVTLAASVPLAIAEDTGPQQPPQGPSAAPNAWIKPLSIAGSVGEDLPGVLDLVAPVVKSDTDGIPLANSAATAEVHAVLLAVAAAECLDWEACSPEVVLQPAIGSLGHADPVDVARGHRTQRGRGRARAERPNDGASAVDRYEMGSSSPLSNII